MSTSILHLPGVATERADADRLHALNDAVAIFALARRTLFDLQRRIAEQSGPATDIQRERMIALVRERHEAGEILLATAMTAVGGGLLDRCIDLIERADWEGAS